VDQEMHRSSVLFPSRRRHTRSKRDWSSDVCSSDLDVINAISSFSTLFLSTLFGLVGPTEASAITAPLALAITPFVLVPPPSIPSTYILCCPRFLSSFKL